MFSGIINISKIAARKNCPEGGRSFGSGKFQEVTEVVRIPTSQKPIILDFLTSYQMMKYEKNVLLEKLIDEGIVSFPIPHPTKVNVPLFGSKVQAGFPSPADDHIETRLDINEYLIRDENATFFSTVGGDSMKDIGICSGDKVVVDKSRTPKVGDVIIGVLFGELTIKFLGKAKNGRPLLIPANPAFSTIEVTEEMGFEVWGVVTGTFRKI